MQRIPMTAKGAKALREELEKLKREDRPRITAAIAEAREHGDLNTTRLVNSRGSARGASTRSSPSSARPRSLISLS
jgi:transcription elongation GreA/GreB family factor